MTTTAIVGNTFDFGRVVKRTVLVTKDNLATFALLSALFTLLPWLIGGLASLPLIRGGGFNPTELGVGILGLVGLGIAFWLVIVMAGYVMQASVVHGAIVAINGRRADFAGCLATGVRHALPLLLLAIVMGAAIFFGCMLFLIPGVMLAVAWAVAIPAQVSENVGVFEALRRSRTLTKGRRWAIFGLILVFFVTYIVIQQVLQSLLGLFIRPVGVHIWLIAGSDMGVALVMGAVSSVVGAVGLTSIYYELRMLKEGVGSEALAAVFD